MACMCVVQFVYLWYCILMLLMVLNNSFVYTVGAFYSIILYIVSILFYSKLRKSNFLFDFFILFYFFYSSFFFTAHIYISIYLCQSDIPLGPNLQEAMRQLPHHIQTQVPL